MRIAWLLAGYLVAHGAIAQVAPAPAVTPRDLGVDPAVLARFDADIAGGKYGNVDSLLILRHGKVVLDRTYAHNYAAIYGEAAKQKRALNALDPGGPYNYFNPWWHPYYRNDGELHSLQSVTKTVTSMVIGVATSHGEFPSLDTPVMKYFDESKVANVDDRKRHLTLRNLITMTVGMKWQDDLPYDDPNNAATMMEGSADWVKFFIDQPMLEEPGTRFYYNDGAPQALSYIFRVATGHDIEEYAAEHLFRPLGIQHWYWKRTPQGVPDTEGGLYLDRHDLAKLMMLFEHDGVWEGRRIVSSDWVKASIAPAVTVDQKAGVQYGYLWWLYQYGKDNSQHAFGGSGFGGQVPLVLPDEDLVIVVNAWNLLHGPDLRTHEIVQRVLAAVTDGKH